MAKRKHNSEAVRGRRPGLMTAVLMTAVLMLCACSPGGGEPGWAAPAKALAPGECPTLAGTYTVDDAVLMALLGYPGREGMPVALQPTGPGNNQLQVRLQHDETHPIDQTAPSQPPQPRQAAVTLIGTCSDGWLQLEWGGAHQAFRDSTGWPQANPERSHSYRVDLRKNAQGALVVRKVGRSWLEFTVWCGDGCKGFPLPATGRQELAYAQWPAYVARPPTEALPPAAQLPPGSPQALALDALRRVLPPSARVLSVAVDDTNNPDGPHGTHRPAGMVVQLSLPPGVSPATTDEALQSWDGNARVVRREPAAGGGTLLVLNVALRPSMDGGDRAAGAQAARDRDASLRAANALFLSKLPRGLGVELHQFQFVGRGEPPRFNAEVRLPPGLSAPDFLNRLRLDGDFIDLEVQGQRPHPMGGTTLLLSLRRL